MTPAEFADIWYRTPLTALKMEYHVLLKEKRLLENRLKASEQNLEMEGEVNNRYFYATNGKLNVTGQHLSKEVGLILDCIFKEYVDLGYDSAQLSGLISIEVQKLLMKYKENR